jgi:hypothetical protein
MPNLKKKSNKLKATSSPLCLILSSSALRASHIFSTVRKQLPWLQALKLFAKHIKVEEQVEWLKKTVGLCVGTPNRMVKLRDLGT